MGWFGKIVGGGVGALVGGPAGAAVGFGLGSAFDQAVSGGGNGFDEGLLSESEATIEEDDAGMALCIQTTSALPDSAMCIVRFFSSDKLPLSASSGACSQYATPDGQLRVSGIINGNVVVAYVPAGAVPPNVSSTIFAVVRLAVPKHDGSFLLLGEKPFSMTSPTAQQWSQVKLIEPLVALGMRVARADHQLLPEEIRHVRDYMQKAFELGASEQSALRKAMKMRHSGSTNTDLVDAIHLRFPYIEGDHLLDMLASIARCDGEISPAEVAVIREIAVECYGLTEAEWSEIQPALGLEVQEPVLPENHWAVLSLVPGSSPAAVKTAYRNKMLAYHPDKVANLAPEFQQLAHEKTIEIRAAYDALLRMAG